VFSAAQRDHNCAQCTLFRQPALIFFLSKVPGVRCERPPYTIECCVARPCKTGGEVISRWLTQVQSPSSRNAFSPTCVSVATEPFLETSCQCLSPIEQLSKSWADGR
jgi:hypothetical protein